jgi:hypothetical protein
MDLDRPLVHFLSSVLSFVAAGCGMNAYPGSILLTGRGRKKKAAGPRTANKRSSGVVGGPLLLARLSGLFQEPLHVGPQLLPLRTLGRG